MSYDYAREQLRWNGWGAVDQGFDLEGRDAAVWSYLQESLGMAELPETPSLQPEDFDLQEPRLDDAQREALLELFDPGRVKFDRYERLFHAVGKSYYDLIRLRRGDIDEFPDAVVYPQTEDEILGLLRYASEQGFAVIPYGGGSSVVGGVESRSGEGKGAVITLDTTKMSSLVELDITSKTATFQAGIYGPKLEELLQERGYTLGHYPQSFEFSTLGGWVAARGAGQVSNRYGTADKFLAAVRMVTPRGLFETKPFPASAAGPNLNHMVAGSEGTLGVISQATVKIHGLPETRDYRGYMFRDFRSGAEAIRKINQAEVPVAMVRLSDSDETHFFGSFKSVGKPPSMMRRLAEAIGDVTGYADGACLMLVGLEGEREAVRLAQAQTLAICLKQQAVPLGAGVGDSWKHGRFAMPYFRDPLLDRGVGVDTLETSTTWDNVHHLHRVVREAIEEAIKARGYDCIVLAHISHSYLTGASLYFTFVFPRDLEDEIGQWRAIKRAASDTISENGGTISHHHGVGADHIDWMEAEKGSLGIDMIASAMRSVDPDGVMNPGKLIPQES